MRKQLGTLMSLMIFCATALLAVGCSGFNRGGGEGCYYDASAGYNWNSDCEPICPEGPKQCGPSREQVIASDITCDGVQVIAKLPNMCLLGDQFCLDLEVHALRDVCDVTIGTTLPEGVQFIRSEPDAFVDGSKLEWTLDHLRNGECQNVRICLRCEREGAACTCFCVSATPVAFCTLVCARPILCCEICGPEEACPGDCLNYTICVTNRGTCTAYDVVVVNQVPDGLEHSKGQSCLTYKLCELAPGQTKRLNICYRACKRGRITNTASVSACNADSCSCECSCTVCKYCCEVVKEGPKEVRIGQNADYDIHVTNVGDRPLTEVNVCDMAPSGTSIVSANGAHISGNRALWQIDELRPGETVTLPITLTTCCPGYYCNRVSVNNCQGACCSAECPCRWRGTPALNVCVLDLTDPVCIGDNTSYRIQVTNQGSEPDENVRVTVRFPREVAPISARGATGGTISGSTVTFAPYSPLGARQTVDFYVEARAHEAGDARIKVEVMSDSITTPIVQEESTIVN